MSHRSNRRRELNCNTIVRHSHDGSASAEILSVGPMAISMNTQDARFPHFYARSSYEAKSAVRTGLWIMALRLKCRPPE